MFKRSFDKLPDGICITDARGKILYLNPAAERLLGVTAEQSRQTLCELLCAHLSVNGSPECASTCELLRPEAAAEVVSYDGRHGPHEVALWKDFGVRRRSVWRNLRVRCLKAPAAWLGKGRHLTVIEEADVADAGRKDD